MRKSQEDNKWKTQRKIKDIMVQIKHELLYERPQLIFSIYFI